MKLDETGPKYSLKGFLHDICRLNRRLKTSVGTATSRSKGDLERGELGKTRAATECRPYKCYSHATQCCALRGHPKVAVMRVR